MKKKLAKRSATCFYIVHLHVGVKGQTRKIRKQEKITNEMLFFCFFSFVHMTIETQLFVSSLLYVFNQH